MKLVIQGAAIAALLALGACDSRTPAENAAENVRDVTENQADVMEEAADNATTENVADAMENKADATRDAGENKADAIEANAQ